MCIINCFCCSPPNHFLSIYSPDDYVKKVESIDGVNVLDFYPIFSEKYEGLYVDGAHFNVRGNYLVAKEISEFIKNKGLL